MNIISAKTVLKSTFTQHKNHQDNILIIVILSLKLQMTCYLMQTMLATFTFSFKNSDSRYYTITHQNIILLC